MLKVILKGFLFGIGFTFALVLSVSLMSSFNLFWFAPPPNYQSISHLPIDEQIEESTVIVRTLHADERAIIEEIVKHSPSVDFAYEVGDEYSPMGSDNRASDLAGDGRIILHTGSPPFAVYALSYDLSLLAQYNHDVKQFLRGEDR